MITQNPEGGSEGFGPRAGGGGTGGSAPLQSSSGIGSDDAHARHAERAPRHDGELTGEARRLAASLFDGQKAGVADGASGLAKALRRAGDELGEQDSSSVGQYVDWAAGRLEGLADGLRHKNLDGLVADAEDLARRQPALFLGGAIVLGFGLARALKSSGRRARTSAYGDASHESHASRASYSERMYASPEPARPATSTNPAGPAIVKDRGIGGSGTTGGGTL